jgi:hypothetical protein
LYSRDRLTIYTLHHLTRVRPTSSYVAKNYPCLAYSVLVNAGHILVGQTRTSLTWLHHPASILELENIQDPGLTCTSDLLTFFLKPGLLGFWAEAL